MISKIRLPINVRKSSCQIIGLSIKNRNRIELTGTVVLEPALDLVVSDFDNENDFEPLISPR